MGKTRLAPLVIAACAVLSSGSIAARQDRAAPAPGSVHGKVTLSGLAPVRESWPVPEDMRPFHAGDTFEDEAWLLGEKGELKNCVILVSPTEPPERKVAPLEEAVFSKMGIRYVPRVLVVTNGTKVTLRNVDSPCNGFGTRTKTGPQFSTMVSAGKERKEVYAGREGPVRMYCVLRDYMWGTIFIADTPHYAVSAADGTYSIEGVPPGRYRVRLWHEKLGYVNKKEERVVTVTAGAKTDASWTIPSPRKE